MKYTITRQSPFSHKKFNVICNGKIAARAKATNSKQYSNQYNVDLLSLIDDYTGQYSCTVECDPKSSHHYFIYSVNQQTDEKTLFGQLSYQLTTRENIYEIIIGQKFYNVRSSDLQDRQLTIIDTITNNGYYPDTLLQINDSFPQANAQYHMNIHDKEWPLGYIAITILLHLHELQRNSS